MVWGPSTVYPPASAAVSAAMAPINAQYLAIAVGHAGVKVADAVGRCVEYAFLVTHLDCSARDLTAACSTPLEPAGACSSPLEPAGPYSRGVDRNAVRPRA